MEQEKIQDWGMTGVRAKINLRELMQMAEMRDRIAHVLNTHKNEKLKKEYLSDDELEKIMTILVVLTREYENCEQSAFDEALAQLKQSKQENATKEENPV